MKKIMCPVEGLNTELATTRKRELYNNTSELKLANIVTTVAKYVYN